MENYKQMQSRHQAEFNSFPIKYAFSNAQFDKGMRELGLDPNDTDKIYAFGDTGGFYRRNDSVSLREMLDRHERERKEAMASKETGDDYIYKMFYDALEQHEYGFMQDASEALESLDLTLEAIYANPQLQHGFERACEAQKNFLGINERKK